MTYPKHWSISTMGQIGRYLNGRAFTEADWKSSGRPIIRIQNLTGTGKEFNYFQGEVEPRYLVKEGDLLFSWAATLGTYIWHGPEAILNQHIFKVESNINPRFHRYLLEYSIQEMQSKTHGSGMVHITKGEFDKIEVPVPPIDEQERIVELLDSYIKNIDTATSELMSDAQRLEDLERSARFSEFERAISADSSKMVQIKDVTEKAKSIHPKTLGVDSFKYVDISSISTDLESPHILEPTETSKAPSRARQQLMEGDTVFSTVRPYQKKIALIKEDLSGHIASTGFCVLRPLSGLVDSRYLYHYLNSDMLLDQVLPLQRGASYPAVGDTDVKQSTMPLPDLATQQDISRNLDAVVGTVKALKNQLETTVEKAQVLRRSLLHQAFSGQLNKEN